MRLQVKRTKEVLSANLEAPISVEEILDGIDFRSSITRQVPQANTCQADNTSKQVLRGRQSLRGVDS